MPFSATLRERPVGARPAARTHPPGTAPLVSCIMPTGNRPSFASLALACFAAQDYANKELVVVDDGDQPLADIVQGHANVRYVRLHKKQSIGRKRNLGCEAASGQILIHWDDDDWHGPRRISQQVAAIAAGESELSGLETRCIVDLLQGEFWTISPALHRRMFAADVHGGTLAFARSVWERGVRYPDVNLAEDAHFLQAALRLGMRLTRVANADLFVYSRHGANAWRFPLGRFLDAGGWTRTAAPSGLPADVLAAYQAAARQHATAESRRPEWARGGVPAA